MSVASGASAGSRLKGGGRGPPRSHVLLHEIRPLLVALRALGALPLRWHPTEGASCRMVSLATAYAVALFVALGTPLAFATARVVRRLLDTGAATTFVQLTLDLLSLAYAHQFCMIPAQNWREARRVAHFFNEWGAFQDEFALATGSGLRLRLRARAWAGLALAAAGAAASTAARLDAREPWAALPMAHLHLMLGLTAAAWDAEAAALAQAAAAIYRCVDKIRPFGLHRFIALPRTRDSLDVAWQVSKEQLFQMPQHYLVSGAPAAATAGAGAGAWPLEKAGGGAGDLRQLRHLWLRLSRLARLQGDAHADTLSHFCLFMSATLTVGAFGALSDVASAGLALEQLRMAVVFAHSALLLRAVCNAAHCATNEVGFAFQEKLLLEDIASRSPQAKEEVDRWLDAMSMTPPTISLNGYAVVNRSMLLSIMTTMVTYLVVLVQFNQSWKSNTPSNSSEECKSG